MYHFVSGLELRSLHIFLHLGVTGTVRVPEGIALGNSPPRQLSGHILISHWERLWYTATIDKCSSHSISLQ